MSLLNAFLVRYGAGWDEVVDAASIAARGRREGSLSLGDVPTADSASVIANQVLATTAGQRVASVAEIQPLTDAETPYVGFVPFDSVRLTGPSGSPETVEVRSITCSVDDWRTPAWTIEARNLAETLAQTTDTLLRRLATGFLDGTTETANPATPLQAVPSEGVRANRESWDFADTLSAVADMESTAWQPTTPIHIMLWHVTLTTAASSGDTTVRLRRNTSTVLATVTIPAGTNVGWAAIAAADGFVNTTDSVDAEFTSIGTGAAGIVAEARYI